MIQTIVHKEVVTFATECFRNGFIRCDGKRIMDEYRVIGKKYCSHCKLRTASQFLHVTMFPSMPGCLRLVCGHCAGQVVPVHCSCGSRFAKIINVPLFGTIILQDYLCEECVGNLHKPFAFWKRRPERMFFGKRQVAAYIYDQS